MVDASGCFERERGILKRKALFLLLFLFLYGSTFAAPEPGCLKIHFIDVGEGDSILIETPKGRSILIDAGNLITGLKVVEYLRKNGIKSLDYLIFTHSDADHIGGAFFVLQMLRVKNTYDNGEDLVQSGTSGDIYRWYNQLVRKNKNYRALRAKATLALDGVLLDVLWPPQKLLFPDPNNNSIVILLKYGKFRCLLTGDLGIPAERQLLEKEINLKADVLKVGHHGAGDSTCYEFLRRVCPKAAVLSVNRVNDRGYPAKEVTCRLGKEVKNLYRTDKEGDIVLSIFQRGSKSFEIKATK